MDGRKHLGVTLISFTVFVLVAVGWLVFLLGRGGALPSFGSSSYQLHVMLPTSSSLTRGARVTMAGVQVGTVKSVDRANLGSDVLVKLTNKHVYPLAADSRARLRQHTPIGENYLAISPGRSATKLKSGGELPLQQADEYVDVDQVLSTLRGPTRERARETLQGLGGALHDRGDQLHELVDSINNFAPGGGRIVQIAHRDRMQAAQLVAQLGDVAAAIGDRGQAIDTIANRGLLALGALSSRDDELAAGLHQLPATLQSVKNIVSTIGPVAHEATPVAGNLTSAVTELRPAVRALPSGTRAARQVLTTLQTANAPLKTTLDQATSLSKVLPSALPVAHKTVCSLAPSVRYVAQYVPEALFILEGLGSSSNSYDATGHLIRLAPVESDNSVQGLPDNVEQAGSDLLHAGLLGRLGNSLNYQPYPKPGDMGHTGATSSEPAGPDKVPQSGYKYPRLEADC